MTVIGIPNPDQAMALWQDVEDYLVRKVSEEKKRAEQNNKFQSDDPQYLINPMHKVKPQMKKTDGSESYEKDLVNGMG
jgi:hypothetical protein